jgi:hypothetical protein
VTGALIWRGERFRRSLLPGSGRVVVGLTDLDRGIDVTRGRNRPRTEYIGRQYNDPHEVAAAPAATNAPI